jgi:colicin import membrane protein
MHKKNLKLSFVSIILGMLFCLGIVSAQEQAAKQLTRETLPQKTQETTAEADKEKLEISLETVEKAMPVYSLSLKQLIEEAEKNIKKVDKELKEQKIFRENRERETKVREYFEKGNLLYGEGKLEEAKKEWQEAVSITGVSEMKGYIQEAERKAREAELARQKAEEERQRQIAAEKREQARLEAEKRRQEELARKEEKRR